MTYNVYLSVGSNIEPETNLVETVRNIASFADVRAISPVYLTKPVRVKPGAEDFHNLCLKISVEDEPKALKDKLRELEETIGRDRSRGNDELHESRKVDVDIILYEPEPEDFEPHRQMYDEAFVVFPLSDIYDPACRKDLPGSVEEWRSNCDEDTIKGTVNYQWPVDVS